MKTMVVAGVMSGTSADGVDVALVRITPRPHAAPRLKLLGHTELAYPTRLRAAVLSAMDATSISTAEMARLHWKLGEVYGDAVVRAQQQLQVRAHLVGIHGQTVYHQATPVPYLGKPLRCTWQLGESSEVAVRTGLPVVHDFRPADMVLQGQGAPLVPIFDRVVFADRKRNRMLQNLGGIANMTAIPAACNDALAFDSGPSNVLIDTCMQKLFGKPYDRNGATAARGAVVQSIVDTLLQDPYFASPPPKSCGREEYGETYTKRLIVLCRKHKASDADAVATATALTAQSILQAYRDFVWPYLGQKAPLATGTDYIVAGGGAKNKTLMQMLRTAFESFRIRVQTSDDYGVPTQAKEAMAFALLAWLRWHQLPGNIPSATGASREALLGKVTLA